MEKIKVMKVTNFWKILKEKIRKKTLAYFKGKTNIKGREIDNKTLHMADYLLLYCNLTIREKQEIFAMRNRMTNIPANFTIYTEMRKCFCNKPEIYPIYMNVKN